MPAYEWRRRPTRHFGFVWVPYATLALHGAGGRYREVSFQIDTGAVITLVRKSVAGMLGIRLEGGEALELGSVAGTPVPVFRHVVEVRLGNLPPFALPVGIADSERVPNLLGRLGIFDRFTATFDPTRHETRFEPI